MLFAFLGALISGTYLANKQSPDSKITEFLKDFTKSFMIALIQNAILSFYF